jgi:hypothetical protein
MDYPLTAPELAGRVAAVRLTGLFSEPQLVIDGATMKPAAGEFRLPPAGSGDPVVVRFKTPALDFIPIVTVNGRQVEIAPPLTIWEYLWCLIPTILLILAGRGFFPAIVGLALSSLSLYEFRAQPARRYVWSALLNLAGFGLAAGLLALRFAALRHLAGR